MCRKRIHERGQVALEYTLATMLTVALGSILFLFYQGFVHGNLYGSAGDKNDRFLLARDYNAFGLEKTVSFPFP